jgi:hypothetical protein
LYAQTTESRVSFIMSDTSSGSVVQTGFRLVFNASNGPVSFATSVVETDGVGTLEMVNSSFVPELNTWYRFEVEITQGVIPGTGLFSAFVTAQGETDRTAILRNQPYSFAATQFPTLFVVPAAAASFSEAVMINNLVLRSGMDEFPGAPVATAVVLASYDFNGAVGGQDAVVPSQTSPGVFASPFSRGAGNGGYQAVFTANAVGTQPGAIIGDTRYRAPYPVDTAIDGKAYFEFTLGAEEGYLISVDAITLGSRRASHNTGPNFMVLRSSLDDFEQNVASGISTAGLGFATSSAIRIDLGSHFRNLSEPVTFRIYGYGRNATDTAYGIWAVSNPHSNATVESGEGSTEYGPEGSSPLLIHGTLFRIPVEGYLLTVTATPGGAVDPSDPVFFDGASEFEILALPLPGYVFESWTGDVNSTANPFPLTVESDLNIVGDFIPDTADDDDDGLSNYEEIWIFGTDPNSPDTSGDGILDGEAVLIGVDPLSDYSAVIGILRNRPDGFGLYDESEIGSRAFGGIMILPDEFPETTILFSVEESADLFFWTEHEIFESFLTTPPGKRFFRVCPIGAGPVSAQD